VAEQRDHVGHHAVEIEPLRAQRLPAPEGKQLLREIGAALGRSLNGQGQLLESGIADLLGHNLGIAEHHHEEIVELVCDAVGALADRLHLLRFAQMYFELPALGNVANDADDFLGPSVPRAHEAEVHLDPDP
jgi:hypothetical protein